ncbi:endonuclease/exonuclease/phosphatase family protein [Sulfurimonas microaerophilic]|uniref:endonuclease/exonuclease/phosphatase family protein n=1 Tax=Sulfurimonas microaerophilic TaxID=3058392 RepID=UPI0027153823|nr:endonuclease/exonuclease/phosphatase family protein [Sulfurimonas sp. hsl 1-7]
MKIATYNVENLFDLKKSGAEYVEYIPYSQSAWDDHSYKTKLKNLSKVIRDIDADIIALQEIESREAFKDLRYQLKRDGLYYQYAKIADAKNTTIKVALLSKVPFVYTKELVVGYAYAFRNILEVKLKVNNEELYIFVNHWKSKAGPESQRISYAKALKKRVQELGNKNIIALGDFNSHYEEYKIFKRKRKHNDTDGKTGINHVLGTINYQTDLSPVLKIKEDEFYNLWYDIDKDDRYSYIYKGKKEALDNILVTGALLDHKGLDYKEDSLHSFVKPYLFKGKNIYRWQMSRGKVRRHKAKGYSDHLAVVAEFTLNTN